jgi:hypothetical protein
MPYPELTARFPTDSNTAPSASGLQITLDWSVDLDTSQVTDAATRANYFVLMEDSVSTVIPLNYVSYTPANKRLILAPSSSLKSNTRYRIIVKAGLLFTDSRRSSNTYNWTFTTATAVIPTTTLLSPGNQTIQPVFPTLNWAVSSASGSVSYQVQIDTRFDFGSVAYQTNTNSTSITPAGSFNDETTYYWRVRAYTSSATGDWSDSWAYFYGREINSSASSRQNYADVDIFELTKMGFNDGKSNCQIWPTISFTFSTTPASTFTNNVSIFGYYLIPRDDIAATYQPVTVNGSWSQSGNTITFTPSDSLINNIRYEVILSGDLTDVNGYRLVDTYTRYFTGPYNPYYCHLRTIRSKFLGSEQQIPDDLINYYIHEASLEAKARFYGYLQVSNIAGILGDALKESIVRDSNNLNSYGVAKWVEHAATYNLLKAILFETTRQIGRTEKLGDGEVALSADFVKGIQESFKREEQELTYWEAFLIPSATPLVVSKNSGWSPVAQNYDFSISDLEARRDYLNRYRPGG